MQAATEETRSAMTSWGVGQEDVEDATPEEVLGVTHKRREEVEESRSATITFQTAMDRMVTFMHREAQGIANYKHSDFCLATLESTWNMPLVDEGDAELGCEPEFLHGAYADIFKFAKALKLDVRVRRLTEDPYGAISKNTKIFIYGIFLRVTYLHSLLRDSARVIERMKERRDAVSAPDFPSH